MQLRIRVRVPFRFFILFCHIPFLHFSHVFHFFHFFMFSTIFIGGMSFFDSSSGMTLFFGKTITPQNGLLIFLGKETHSETKSWKSSRILTKKVTTTTVNPGGFCECSQISSFFHCSSFFVFFSKKNSHFF